MEEHILVVEKNKVEILFCYLGVLKVGFKT